MATVTICDRCENEIDARVRTVRIIQTDAEFDLCALCNDALGDFLRGAMLNDASVKTLRELEAAS